MELGSIQGQLPGLLQGQQGRSSCALLLLSPGLFIDSASYSAETNPHSSRVPGPAAPAFSPSASGSIFWGHSQPHNTTLASAGPEGGLGRVTVPRWQVVTQKPPREQARMDRPWWGGSGCGVRGWGLPYLPFQPPTPSTVMPGASARCQPESIFIPCLKISLSGSLAYDRSSFL